MILTEKIACNRDLSTREYYKFILGALIDKLRQRTYVYFF
jgi:hypothetical protein